MKKLLFALLAFAAGTVVLHGAPAVKQIVKCGDYEITLVSHHFWNLNSVDYAGINLCRPQSFFGNVARFKCGWVGTGHLENKIGEKELNVKFFADGKEFVPNGKTVAVNDFEMKKSSVLLDLKIDYTLKFSAGKIVEYAKVTVLRDTELNMLYLFMHPWCALFEYGVYQYADGSEAKIVFDASNLKKIIEKRGVVKVTYFAPKEQLAATTTLKTIKGVPGGKEAFLFWNRGVDRKLYFKPVGKQKLNAGVAFEYELTTVIEKKIK